MTRHEGWAVCPYQGCHAHLQRTQEGTLRDGVHAHLTVVHKMHPTEAWQLTKEIRHP